MQGFRVLNGGAAGAQAYAETLGQIHHAPTDSVSNSDVIDELAHRGYRVQAAHVPVHHVAPPARTLTKSMAISVAIDEALERMNLPRTRTHPYRCPSSGCGITQRQWDVMVRWCVTVANGYLAGQYSLPSWALSALHSGALHGVAMSGLGGLGNLGTFAEWIQENNWLVSSVGDTIANYGEYLTAKNVQDAIKANTAGQFTKADATALIAALQQQGMITPGKAADVAAGANAAASPSWMMPAMIGGAALVVILLMKK